MLKKIKALVTSVIMAGVFPAVRADGTGEGAPAGNSTRKTVTADTAIERPVKPGEEGTEGSRSGLQAEHPAGTTTGNVPPEDRIGELETELADRTQQIAELEKKQRETIVKSESLNESLKKAVSRYQSLLIKSHPEVLPELITGDSIETLDESLTRAMDLTEKVKNNLAAQVQRNRVPAGAPVRGAAAAGSLTSRDKIRRGLGA